MKEKLILSLRNDLRIAVPDDLEAMSTYVFLEQDDWFEAEAPFLRWWLRPGMRAIDVGANHGYYTLTLARAVAPGGHVWSVEPNPDCVAHLETSLRLNDLDGAVTLVPAALADRAGEGRLSAALGSEHGRVAGGAGAGVAVRLETLDALDALHGLTEIDFVKLDAEGAEERILAGGAAFFRRESPLLMFEAVVGKDERSPLIAQLPQQGWRLCRLAPALGALVPYDDAAWVEIPPLNLFACKPDRAAALAGEGALVVPDEAPPLPPAPRDLFLGYLASLPANLDTPNLKESFEQWAALPATAPYLGALNDWLLSRDPTQPTGLRMRHLARAFAVLDGMRQTGISAERALSFVRVALDYGARWSASKVLKMLVDGVWLKRRGGDPYLMPSVEAETTRPGPRPNDWLRGQLIVACEHVGSYSSYLSAQDSAQRLWQMETLIPMPIAMERRKALIRLRDGGREAVTVTARLTEPAPDHLNAAFWARLRD